ncbi:MAG: serpin family protein [Clostridiales bacterium]|nr:serpin family protein [Clostridiales bacterium]
MKKLLLILITISLLFSMVACATSSEFNGVYAADKSDNVITANSKFSFEFFKEINKSDQNKNVFISPYSISSALSMLYNGANGQTESEMASMLHYDKITDEDLNNGMMYLRKRLESIKNVELSIDNSIWIRENFPIKESFIDISKFVFDAYVTEIDMDNPKAADTINDYIKKKTNGMIDKMLDPPINSDVIMYLINTIYFDGKWTNPFNEENSTNDLFTNYDGSNVEVNMMYLQTDYFYGEKNNEKIIEVPYGDGEVSMYLILPDVGQDINEFIDELSHEKWLDLRYDVLEENKQEVTLSMPSFKIEYGIKEISGELQTLGMKEAFKDYADFTGIANNIYVSRVLHKAVIEVDEVGTKAAAATVVEMKLTSMPMDPLTFTANRPFIYIIADNTDDTILFMGKMVDMN